MRPRDERPLMVSEKSRNEENKDFLSFISENKE
jgi:hypothetical protein